MSDRRLALAVATALVFLTAGCTSGPGEYVALPEELIGRWETAAPRYADRYLQLTSDRLVIGTGPETAESYTLDRVHRMEDDEGVLYTIEYSDDAGESYTMGFYFDPEIGDQIRMRNQLDMVWSKVQ